MKRNSRRILGAGLGATVCGMLAAAALASPPSLITSSNLVAKADFDTPVDIKADRIRLRTEEPTDVRVQKVVFAPGGRTGWHHHPGIVLVAVESGQVTVVDPNCNETTYGPGSPNGAVFTEVGTEPREVRNLSGAEATVYATLIAPNAETDIFRAEDAVGACP
jgi:predicted metal-dependent enzyme (double-stranded beta helix superfamily)